MATSTIVHSGEQQPVVNKGHGTDALGPSDSSDSGSDVRGAQVYPEGDMGEIDADTDAGGTGERAAATSETSAREAGDIGVDRVVTGAEIGAPESGAPWTEGDHAESQALAGSSIRQRRQESAEDAAVNEEEGDAEQA